MKTRTIAYKCDFRTAFWAAHPELANAARLRFGCDPNRVRQNRHNATTRSAFVEYVDAMARSGAITEDFAQDVTL
jgi:hypothetical protein